MCLASAKNSQRSTNAPSEGAQRGEQRSQGAASMWHEQPRRQQEQDRQRPRTTRATMRRNVRACRRATHEPHFLRQVIGFGVRTFEHASPCVAADRSRRRAWRAADRIDVAPVLHASAPPERSRPRSRRAAIMFDTGRPSAASAIGAEQQAAGQNSENRRYTGGTRRWRHAGIGVQRGVDHRGAVRSCASDGMASSATASTHAARATPPRRPCERPQRPRARAQRQARTSPSPP